MFTLSRWSVEQGPPLRASGVTEGLLWQDPETPLSIWTLGEREQAGYRLRISGLVVDIVPPGRVVIRSTSGLPKTTIDHFLADQVFPRLLADAGSFIIHAGAVRVENEAILLMGDSGRGKSTLVASFDQVGMPLLGDDAMIIDTVGSVATVRAVYPSLRLLPDSIDALMPGKITAGPVAHYSRKERIDVAGDRGNDETAPQICAIFAIGEATADVIDIHALSPAEACIALVTNSFALDPSNTAKARDRMERASALARQVPAFDIAYPRDYARLPEVRQAILDQVAALAPA